jgi:hypothetical protein
MDWALGDAAVALDPLRGLAQMVSGLSSLSGILLDELAQITGRPPGEVLHNLHQCHLNPSLPSRHGDISG